MTRSTLLVALVFASVLPLAPESSAQTTRRRITGGDVQGMELGLDGSLMVARGSSTTWLLSAYDVLGVDRLRPSAGAKIVVTSAVQPGEPVAEVEADDRGRAIVRLTMPDDAPPAVGVTISLFSKAEVQRRFELTVRTRINRGLRVFLAPPAAGEPVVALGRLTDHAGQGIAEAPIELIFSDTRGVVGAPVAVTTDPHGLFVGRVDPPADLVGNVLVRAFHGRAAERVSDQDQSGLRTPGARDLLVQIAPSSRVVSPEADVPVDIVVRRADGMPVPEARVRLGNRMPVAAEGMQQLPDEVLTDERGRARLVWEAPRLNQPFRDTNITVAAGHAAHGGGIGTALVRVARERYGSALSVEGGALTPELGGRIFVRVANIDGRSAEDVGVTIRGPRIGDHQGATDAAGVAAFEVPLTGAADDRCGGASSASLTVVVDGKEKPFCVPVEVDGAARVSIAPLVAPGDPVEVRITRAPRARRLPVVVRADGAIMSSVVAEPGQDVVQLPIPPEARGLIEVRARPIVDGREVYGGSVAAWIAPLAGANALEEPLRLQANGPGATLSASLSGSEAATAAMVAVPIDSLPTLRGRLQSSDPFATQRGTPTLLGISAVLAELTTRDVTVPSVYRDACEGRRGACVVPMPAPSNAAGRGLLRDPWRASDRFIEGRLALVFRALEDRIAASVPGNLDAVSHVERGRRVLDDHVLASLPEHQLGGEGATGLGGEPLTMDMLRRIDPSFSFDSVAERITRERLFVLLLALRSFVNQRGLDLPWARPGEPGLWLRQLVGHHAGGRTIQARDLVDGWGRPFELRPTNRPRFSQLQPVAGHELISVGPDGRAGNGNDVTDPTARVLRSGTIYARAVGEDALLARLNGVELGRATLDMAAQIHGQGAPAIQPPDESRARVDLGSLPPVLEFPSDPLALRRPAIPAGSAAATGREVSLQVGDEPRTWGVLAWVVDGTGRERLLESTTRGGAPAFVTPELMRRAGAVVGPEMVRMGEPLAWPLRIVNATDQSLEVPLAPRGTGVGLEAPGSLTIAPETGARVDVVFRGESPGRAQWALEGAGSVIARGRLTVDRGLHPLRRSASGLARERWHGEMGDLSGARHPHARVVLLGRGGLGADPDLAEARRDEAALLGWHAAMVGRGLDPDLAARVERSGGRTGRSPQVSMAASLVSLAATLQAEDERTEARQLVSTLSQQVAGGFPLHGELSDEALADLAAVVSVLATSAITPVESRVWPMEDTIMPRPMSDPLSQFVANARVVLRRALHERTDKPALQARAAAALLLTDPRDGHGRAIVARLKESDALRRMGLAGEDREDSFEGTLALSIAAHQLGEDALAERMARGAANHAGFAARARGTALFWWLALDAYGVFGAEAPSSVEVDVDGTTHTVTLEQGVGVLDLEGATPSDVVVEAEEGPVFARAEILYGRSFQANEERPLGVALEGRLGAVGVPAGYEVQVTSTAAVGTPVIDIQLPASAVVDDGFIRAVQAAPAVRTVEVREPGFLRVHLIQLRAEQAVTFALPFVRVSPSPVSGLGMVAYPASRPDAMTVLPPRRIGE
ncbi:MAG: hypothetical protein JJ863_33475 [Deltaproteobacteria bacterium]|nr:hypothetical protein [Deltaproteobacteria bacterium]